MLRTTLAWMMAATVIASASEARAQVVSYTDEATFLAALASQGYPAAQEGFEDDAAWGSVRSSIVGGSNTAPSITNLDVTWTSISPNNNITTGSGAARTGNWGFYSLPHGDYENGIGDGFSGTGLQPLVAIGGWITTNTPPAKLGLLLDGIAVDFGAADVLGTQYRFFGAIAPGGFFQFDFRELEGTIGDQKLIFGDDFTFAFGGTVVDCNNNGVADPVDIAATTSSDCNINLVPDECEIDENSSAPGGPFFCMENCDPDCNVNGLLDACEVAVQQSYASGQLSPIGNGAPQSYTIFAPPVSRANVIMTFTAHANLGGAPDVISVDVNGVSVGTVFGPDGSDCPETQPDVTQLVVPMVTFNGAVAGGDAVIGMTATDEVDPTGCDNPTYVAVEVTLFVSSSADLDENGIPDECEVEPVPAASDWVMLLMALLLLTAGTIVIGRRPVTGKGTDRSPAGRR